MSPLKAIYPYSPFGFIARWECCNCKQWNLVYHTYCREQTCRHPVCENKCTITTRRGLSFTLASRIPTNWVCQNEKHLPEESNTQIIHSVGELLVAETVECYCQAPVFTTDAVYDQWGNRMATLSRTDYATNDTTETYPDCLNEPPAFSFNLEMSTERELAAAILRGIEGMSAWNSILEHVQTTKAVVTSLKTPPQVDGELKIKGSASSKKRKAETVDEDAVKEAKPVRYSKRLRGKNQSKNRA